MSGDGMTDFVSALTTGGLTSSGLWTEVSNAATLIASLTIFAFGVYIVRRVIKKGSKGKGGF